MHKTFSFGVILAAGIITLNTSTALSATQFTGAKSVSAVNDGMYHGKFIQVTDEITVGAQEFIEDMASRGLAFLENPSLSKADQKEEFKYLLNDSFDLRTIGRFALGRYWRQASPEQREEYFEKFESMVVNSYAERFDDYQGQKLVVNNARADSENDTIVFSTIRAQGSSPSIRVDWRVRYSNGAYRVVDVLVEGVSMSLTQRSEFASIIQRGGGNVEALLRKLR